MNNVLIIDFKGLISTGGLDVLRRHEEYAKSLRNINEDYGVVVLTSYSKGTLARSNFIEFVYTRGITSFIRSGARLLKTSSIKLLVCGDPWGSFLLANTIQRLAGIKLPIQVQVHADVGDHSWKRVGFRNRVKSLLVPFALRNSSQVRCVSKQQLLNLIQLNKEQAFNSVIVPVPLSIEANLSENQKLAPQFTLALVGRIDYDRGLEEFLDIARISAEQLPIVDIYVIGSGPREMWLQKSIEQLGLNDKVKFFGQLNQDTIQGLWKEVGVLLSLAPIESYGRSVREALIHRVPVIAKRTSGLKELEDIFLGKGLFYSEDFEVEELIALIQRTFSLLVAKESVEVILLESRNASNLLAKSWMALMTFSN